MTADDCLLSGASSESSFPPNKSSGDIVELKPCPFCGGKARMLTYRTSEDSEGAHAACVACGAQTEETDDAYADTLTAAHIWNTRTPDPESAAEIERLKRENETSEKFKAGLRELLGTPPDGSIVQSLMELATKLRTAESAVAAAWEEAAKIAETVPMGMENHPQKIASAIRAAVSKKTAESGHSPPTHNSESE